MAVSEEERWKRAFKAVTRQFNIENLLEEQQKSLREFLGGHNIFGNLPTGFGKPVANFSVLAHRDCCFVYKTTRLKCCGLVG